MIMIRSQCSAQPQEIWKRNCC